MRIACAVATLVVLVAGAVLAGCSAPGPERVAGQAAPAGQIGPPASSTPAKPTPIRANPEEPEPGHWPRPFPVPPTEQEPPGKPTAPSDAECAELAGELLSQGKPNAVVNPRLRQEGCGRWLDARQQQAAAGKTPTPVPTDVEPPFDSDDVGKPCTMTGNEGIKHGTVTRRSDSPTGFGCIIG